MRYISRIKPTLSHALLARAHELTATDVIRDRDLFTAIFAAMDHDIISQEAGWVIAEGARVLYPDLYDVGSINFYALGETIQGIVNDIDKIKQGARGQPWQFAGQFLTQRGYITDVKELAHISSASELFDAYPVIRAELNRRVAAALLRFTDKTYLEHNFCIDEARIHAACRVGLIDKHFITTMDRQLARGKFLSSGIEPHLIRAGVWAGVTGAGLVSALSGLLRAKEINKVTEGIYGDWIALAMAIGGLVLTFIGVGMNTRALHRARDRADDLLK